MGEPAPGLDIRRILLIAGVSAVVLVSLLFFFLRGCASTVRKGAGYTVVYSNLTLKDAANSIARLKELAIPYEIRDDGKAIAVPKEKADQARLGLAEKNLPAGGVVGWEIFDQSKLGATDFDRRIQLIRAISGELSRTIRGIESVEDAHIQIVIPETRLFAETVTPVTASVMLRLTPGTELSREKINGIVHLVASSVENLQPENVTVIDSTGQILSAKISAEVQPIAATAPMPVVPETVATPAATTVIVKSSPEAAATSSGEAVATEEAVVEVPAKQITPEEKAMLLMQAKKAMEIDLAGKAQEILNRFYPLNSTIIKVTIDLADNSKKGMAKTAPAQLHIGKITAIVLIDNRVDLTKMLKQSTYKSVAAAVGYNHRRGDKIVLQRVPFHLASSVETPKKEEPKVVLPVKSPSRKPHWILGNIWFYGGIIAALLAVYVIYRTVRKEPEPVRERTAMAPAASPAPAYNQEKVSALDDIRSAVEKNPEQIANMLRKWLSE